MVERRMRNEQVVSRRFFHPRVTAMRLTALVAACVLLAAPALAQTEVRAYGVSSWYGFELAGKAMSNGRPFRPMAYTAACWFLPLGTKARVTNLANGRAVTVTITDRGPGVPGRLIDLSLAAAREIGMERAGLARVRVEAVVPAVHEPGVTHGK